MCICLGSLPSILLLAPGSPAVLDRSREPQGRALFAYRIYRYIERVCVCVCVIRTRTQPLVEHAGVPKLDAKWPDLTVIYPGFCP